RAFPVAKESCRKRRGRPPVGKNVGEEGRQARAKGTRKGQQPGPAGPTGHASGRSCFASALPTALLHTRETEAWGPSLLPVHHRPLLAQPRCTNQVRLGRSRDA